MSSLCANSHLVCGRTGTGKSTHVMGLVAGVERIFVWSPKEIRDDYAGKLCALKIESVAELVKCLQGLNGVVKSKIVFCAPIFGGQKIFELVCARLLNLGNFSLVVEEAYTVATVSAKLPYFGVLCSQGRDLGLGGGKYPNVFVSTRIVQLNQSVRTQVEHVVVHALGGVSDVDEICKGLAMADTELDVKAVVGGLRGFDYVDYDRTTGKLLIKKGKTIGNSEAKKGSGGNVRSSKKVESRKRIIQKNAQIH